MTNQDFIWSPKDPNDIRDYFFDWGSNFIKDPRKRFLPEDVTITESIVTFPDFGDGALEKVDDDITPDGKRVRFRSAGGIIGKYQITNLITVSTGEQFEVTMTLQVKERVK